MQKFKQIREAAKYNPYAIGMAAAKKKAGIGAKHAEGLPKAVIVKGHEIAKKIKANEEFDSVLEQLDFELSLEEYTAEELQAFMESEDFEQLDELSRKTLASYVKGAVNDIDRRKDAAQSFKDRADDMRKISHEVGVNIGRGAAKDEIDAKRREYETKADKHLMKAGKRGQGALKALDKLSK